MPSHDPTYRHQLALAWRSALHVPRSGFFDNEDWLPKSLAASAHTSYLGWVGKNYRGGTVVVGKNPGGGGDAQVAPKEADLAVEAALRALRDGPEDQAEVLLNRVTDAYHAQLQSIAFGRLLGHVLTALGESRDDVAFINFSPYRTRQDGPLSGDTQRRSRALVATPVLEALAPDTVVCLGVGISREVCKAYAPTWRYVLHRARSDAQMHALAPAQLAALAEDNEARRTLRSKKTS